MTACDTSVKLWQLELIALPDASRKVLSLLHLKTLELGESIQCVKISPDNKLLAVALFDNNIKLFFMDTFKVYYNFELKIYNCIVCIFCSTHLQILSNKI